MSSDIETELWAWLLYDAGIKTYSAKQLLTLLEEKNISLEELRSMPPTKLTSLGLGSYQSTLSHSPTARKVISAVRWNAPQYPQGLQDLDIKYKPALLFYDGDLELLARPIIYMLPGVSLPQTEGLLAGVVELLLDGSLLPAAFAASPQEALLIGQMTVNDGEALIFVDQGLDCWTPSAVITKLIRAGRILALSPMPPGTAANPALTPILHRIAAAAANRWVAAANPDPPALLSELSRPTLHILADQIPGEPQFPDVSPAFDIDDAINWLNNAFIPEAKGTGDEARISVDEILPPLSSESVLHILERGGKVPEALRQRLLKK